METERKFSDRQSSGLIKAILLVLVGLAINLLFSNIVKWLDLPLYIDNVGIILTSVLGGYIPGVAVGYITNAINGISDATSYYYGTLSVINAVIGAYGAHRGWFKKIPTIILAILLLTFSGGVLGSILTWMLYGFDPEYAKPVASKLYESGFSPFWAQFCSDVFYDVIDKTITVLLVLMFLYLIEKLFKITKVNFDFWHQTALSEEELLAVKKNKTRKMSLRGKVLLLLAGVMIIIAFVTTGISFMLYRDKLIDDNGDMGHGITNITAELIDPERIDEYIRMGKRSGEYEGMYLGEANGRSPEYNTIVGEMERIARSHDDIAYVYVVRMTTGGYEVIFDADVGDENLWQPGQIVPFQEDIEPYIDLALKGEPIPDIIMNDEYGWLLSIFTPVYDKDGQCVCYSCCDINMDHLLNDEKNFLAKVISLFVGFFVMVLAVFLWLTDYCIIYPINSIAIAARDMAFNIEGAKKEDVDHIRKLGINTGDEIETLFKALAKTSEDIVKYVSDIKEHKNTINRMQNALITVLANMVESRDKYTGNHVKNTAAYAKIILDELKKIDKYKNIVTDDYEDIVINSAPLHDVGKIKVSDILLNKNGKLDDDEFSMMKDHTIAGQRIIEEAADMVSDSAYLQEAKNLAAYHHEKWNGTGYPYGLKGEDIPLSARIMAVADVFDALVSKRSYKPGFSVDKALQIIRDGIGTHFDPEIANVFLQCEDEVRRVAAENVEKDADEEK